MHSDVTLSSAVLVGKMRAKESRYEFRPLADNCRHNDGDGAKEFKVSPSVNVGLSVRWVSDFHPQVIKAVVCLR